ncbi:hypothetical protein QBC46DRAFT_272201 [Diplogelasinospora grovesii]|uniref:Ribosomal protein s17 n=1 Tax=Diplogelasinospora grovesii TaxID=303347 RepID=A0AAN6S0F9_9PEZI|nr:hypothetical protein QBC46DRAFT_272201 [Diplogelasinospora grovesii]
MLMKTALVALMGLSLAVEAASIRQIPSLGGLERRQRGGNKNNNNGNANTGNNNAANGGTQTCLAANAVQTGSQSTGQNSAVAADGQVNSATDNANFINFCSGQTLTNGLQQKQGSCNGIPMGKIPATTNMVSTVIVNPQNMDNLAAQQTFNVTVNVQNMQLGSFTNATSTYYAAPQNLNGQGKIIGHTHVTIQNTGNSLNPTTPLDATQFVFFKGINDAGNGQGLLTTAVTGGLPAGNYRVCTMSSASNHQPVLMPVAQRGAQDDCRYFTVGGAGNNGNNAASNNAASNAAASASAAAGNAAASGTASKGKGGKGSSGNAAASTSAAATAANAATTSAAAASSGNGASRGKGKASSSGNSSQGAIGGIAAPAVTNSGNSARPFSVNGNTFVNQSAAVQRACAIQNNACADAVNAGKVQGATVADCNQQETQCNTAGGAA